MESVNIYDQFDFNAFMRRRGLRVVIGLIILLGVVLTHLYKLWEPMKNLLQLIDSLLGSASDKAISISADPTMYQVETTNNKVYSGYIIHQNDVMMKFRTTSLKPIKILKSNIVRVTIMSRQYVTAGIWLPGAFSIL